MNVLYDLSEKYGGRHWQKPVNLEHVHFLKDLFYEKLTLEDSVAVAAERLISYNIHNPHLLRGGIV